MSVGRQAPLDSQRDSQVQIELFSCVAHALRQTFMSYGDHMISSMVWISSMIT